MVDAGADSGADSGADGGADSGTDGAAVDVAEAPLDMGEDVEVPSQWAEGEVIDLDMGGDDPVPSQWAEGEVIDLDMGGDDPVPSQWAEGEVIDLDMGGDDPVPSQWAGSEPALDMGGDDPVPSQWAGSEPALDMGGDDPVPSRWVEEGARADVYSAAAAAEADGRPPATREQFEADAAAWADQYVADPSVRQVEFREPGPAKEVEFREPGPAKEVEFVVPDGSEAALESRSPEEQRVVDQAKADLVARETAGAVIGGDPVARAEEWHPQGQNDLNYRNDCALASVAGTLRDCGVDTSENDVVAHAAATGHCDTGHADATENGGSTGEDIHQLLEEYGVPNTVENPQSAEDLAEMVEQGRGVITEINAYELWDVPVTAATPAYYDESGRAGVDHAVQVTGTVRDGSGNLTGFVINDTGHDAGAARVVDLDEWDACWTNTDNDHETIVTDRPTAEERSRR